MKNLKKVLALGLALVMILGMFTIASAAETEIKTADKFPDWNDVENKDAVSLMVDLGVINGTDKGTYAPAENINRASWAKMVFFVLTGETDGKIYESDYPTLKDIDGNWAQGFIEYLYSFEYVAGDNEGNYNPDKSITVVEAAKTMLTGLGYNSKVEGYESNKNWATNIMTKAKAIGLLKGITLKQGDDITRDAAAQMVYNALSAQIATPGKSLNPMTGEYVPNGEYTYGDTLGKDKFDIVKVTATVDSVSEKGVATLSGVKDADGKAVSGTVSGEVKASLKDMGKTVTLWTKSDYSEFVSTSVASGAMTPVKIDTDGVDWAKALVEKPDADDKKDDDFAGEPDETVSYFKNGDTSTQEGYTPKTGDVVEYYDTDDNGKIDVVHVYAYSIAKVNADPTSKTKDDVTTVTLNFGGLRVPTDQITGDWASLKKDDIVLYYANKAGTMVNFEKAKKISGKVDYVSGDETKLTINNTDYTASGISGATASFAEWNDYKNEYDFYLDKNDSIAIMDQITNEVTSDVALVLESAWVGAQGGIGGAKGYAQAKLLFTDGEEPQVVKVVELDGDDKNLETSMGSNAMLNDKTAVFVEASEDNGEWTLTTIKSEKVTEIAKDTDVVAKIGFTDDLSADTETVFIVAKGNADDGYTYTVHTGFKTVPGLTTSEKSYAYTKDGGAVDYVYLIAESFTGDAPEGYVYFKSADPARSNANGHVFKVIDAEGEEKDLTLKTDMVDAAGFYKIKTVNDDGVVTALANTTAAEVADVKNSGKGGFEANIVVEYDDTTKCVVIDLDSKGGFDTVSTFDPDSIDISVYDAEKDEGTYDSVKALIVGEENGVADYIYVVRTALA